MAASTSSTMYRTLTISRGSVMASPFALRGRRSPGDGRDQEPDAGRQLGGRLLEERIGRLVIRVARRRVGDAPVDGLGLAGELGAHLAQPVTQADHPVETLL